MTSFVVEAAGLSATGPLAPVIELLGALIAFSVFTIDSCDSSPIVFYLAMGAGPGLGLKVGADSF